MTTTATNTSTAGNLKCPRCRAQLRLLQSPSGTDGLVLPPTPPQMTLDELEEIIDAVGTAAATARLAGFSDRYISNCRHGRHPISSRLALALRAVIAEGRHHQVPRLRPPSPKGGRPRAISAMSIEELTTIIADMGSVSAAARNAGCSRAYVIRCRDGKQPVSQKIADKLRASSNRSQNA